MFEKFTSEFKRWLKPINESNRHKNGGKRDRLIKERLQVINHTPLERRGKVWHMDTNDNFPMLSLGCTLLCVFPFTKKNKSFMVKVKQKLLKLLFSKAINHLESTQCQNNMTNLLNNLANKRFLAFSCKIFICLFYSLALCSSSMNILISDALNSG